MKNTSIKIIADNSLSTLQDNPWKKTTEWFEYHLGAKWYAVQAYCEDELVGFMHMIKHPERPFEWYFCDVHTKEQYKRQGVATNMYEEALNLLLKYDKAYRITASVKCDNEASVKLHEKMGFFNTHEASVFPDLSFEFGETIHEHYFVREYPARNLPMHKEILAIHAGAKKDAVWAELEQSEHDSAVKVFIIWAGEISVGYRLVKKDETEIVLLPEWRKHLENKCLEIR